MLENGDLHPPPPPTLNVTLLSIMSKDKHIGPNYMVWMRNLKMTLHYENKEYVLKIMFLKSMKQLLFMRKFLNVNNTLTMPLRSFAL